MPKVYILKDRNYATLTANGNYTSISVSNLFDRYAIKIVFEGKKVGVLASSPEVEKLEELLAPYLDNTKHITVKINGGDGTPDSKEYLATVQKFFSTLDTGHPDLFTITYDVGIPHDNGCMLMGKDLV